MAVRVGCCGFPVAQDRYWRTFPVLEVQKTFYQVPRLHTLAGWRERAPEDSEFALKAWQLITHEASSPTYRRLQEKLTPAQLRRCGAFQPTKEVFAAWERTAEAARALRAGVVVFQCPASFKPTPENLQHFEHFFKKIRRGELRLVWEPRGPAWEASLVGRLCRKFDLTHGVDPFKQAPAAGEVRYYRLHGIRGYRYRFTEGDLRRLADFCRGRHATYVLFNNASMWNDAQRFRRLLRRNRGE